MNIETILEKIGTSYVLKVPKQNLRESGRMPLLVDRFRQDHEFKRQPILVGWEEVDKLLKMERLLLGNMLCKVEKEDLKDGDRVYKQGWKSMGWDGENFDYYRLLR